MKKPKKRRLTAKLVAKLLKRGPGRYRDHSEHVRGLMLVVVNENNASWQLRYEQNGRERWHGLGPVREFKLQEARERAREARQKLREGIDPIEAKKKAKADTALAAAQTMTFQEAADKYFDQHASKWKNAKHRAQFLTTLRAYAYPVIGALPVRMIDTPLVLKVLERPVAATRGHPAGALWQARPETASRVRNRIEGILDWAAVRGFRSGDNPARWKGHLAEVLPARAKIAQIQHFPALPYKELPDFLTELRKHAGVAARALEFSILTAARTGEVVYAKWDEIDLATATWTIPAGRMKARKEHRVPLSPAAVMLLKALYTTQDDNPHVFVGSRPGTPLSYTGMAALLRRIRTDITVHGFRSSFRDWAAERSNFANHVVEQALSHAVGSAVEKAYRRGDMLDKRRKLMEAWATYCITKPGKTGEVVPLHKVIAHAPAGP